MFTAIKNYFLNKISNKKKVSPIANPNLPTKPVETKINNFIPNNMVPDSKLSAPKTNFDDIKDGKLQINVAEVISSKNPTKTHIETYQAPDSCTPVNQLPDRTNSLSPTDNHILQSILPHALNTAHTRSPKSDSSGKINRANTLSPHNSPASNINHNINTPSSNAIYNYSSSPSKNANSSSHSNQNKGEGVIEVGSDLANIAYYGRSEKNSILEKIKKRTLSKVLPVISTTPSNHSDQAQSSPTLKQQTPSNVVNINSPLTIKLPSKNNNEPPRSPLGRAMDASTFNGTESLSSGKDSSSLDGTMTSTLSLNHKVVVTEDSGQPLKTNESVPANPVSNDNNLNVVAKPKHGKSPSKRFSFDLTEIAKLDKNYLNPKASQAEESSPDIQVTSQATEINVTANTQVEPKKENYIPVDDENTLIEVASPKNTLNVPEANSPQTKTASISAYTSVEENDSESHSESDTSKIKRLLFGLSSSPYTPNNRINNNRINAPAKPIIPVTPKYQQAIKQYNMVGLMFNNQNKVATQQHANLMQTFYERQGNIVDAVVAKRQGNK